MTEFAHQQDLVEKPLVLRDFIDPFNNAGIDPDSANGSRDDFERGTRAIAQFGIAG